MSWQELQKDYLEKIPIFPSLPRLFSAEELLEFLKGKTQVSELEAINTVRFQRKFKEYVTSGDSFRELLERFQEVSRLSQKLFERHFAASNNKKNLV